MRKSGDMYLRGTMFSTFFGGGDPSWGAARDCYTYFKNFKLYHIDQHTSSSDPDMCPTSQIVG